MKKIATLLTVFLILVLFTACPYNSKIPLSTQPKLAIDNALVGDWRSLNDKDSLDMKVMGFNQNEYFIDIRPADKMSEEVSRYRAFLSNVGDEKFISIEELKKKNEFNFFSYKIESDVLTIRMVSDVVVKEVYESPKKMTKAFLKMKNGKDFYETEIKFKRKK